jgi:hypothetical protein
MSVYFPLIEGSKRPAKSGWADENYQGVDPVAGGWFGRRADGYVIIDCDSEQAANDWTLRCGAPATFTVKTPRGYHYYYRWVPGSPTGPYVAVLPGIDVRAGRGSYVVWHKAPGYSLALDHRPVDFDPTWLPERSTEQQEGTGETWEQIPEGRRNATLLAFGGSLRKQGMATPVMAEALVAMNRAYCDPPLDQDEVIAIVKSVSRYDIDHDGGEKIQWEDDIESSGLPVQWAKTMKMPPPPEWYWQPYFPEGKLVFMDGREGIGKGMLCTWLSVAVSTGQNPDGTKGTAANVLWLPTEDDPEEDILRRLFAAGYEPGKHADIGFINERLKVPEHEDILIEAIRESGAKLVILDPGRSYLGAPKGETLRDFSFNNEAHIRPGMESLIRVAKQTGACVLFVHHWNKDQKGDIFYRQSGSGGFNQVIRHRVTIARVEQDGDIDGAFAVTKSNIIDPGHVHGFTLEAVEEFSTARFVLRTPMPEWNSLDEWYKAAQEHREDEITFIPVDRLYNMLSFDMTQGSLLPPRRELMEATGLSQRRIDDALKILADEGTILSEKGKPSVWLG